MGDRCTSCKYSARYSPFASKKTKEQKQLHPDLRLSIACGEQKESTCFASHPFAKHCRNVDCCTPGFYEWEIKVAHVPSAGKTEAYSGERRTRLLSRVDRSMDTKLELR